MEKAMDLVRELAGKLGQTVETLWPSAVRYVVVDGVADFLIGGVVGTVLLLVTLKLAKWLKEDEQGYHAEWAIPVAIFSGIIGLVFWCVALSQIPAIFEPTGYLIHQAIRGVRQ